MSRGAGRPRPLLALLLIAALFPLPSAAQPPAPAPPSSAPARAEAGAWGGVVVVSLAGATDASWALAQRVYADTRLRPPRLDDASARVLAGEAPAAGATAKLRELAELRAALRGDDAPSRALLASLLRGLGASVAAVVDVREGQPRAWVFQGETFDPTPLAADPGPLTGWLGATAALAARAPAAPAAAPAAPAPRKSSVLRSGWFWGALGAAAAAGLLVWSVSRSSGGSDAIPLRARFADK